MASDRGAPKEIIKHGLDGFIVNPEETGKLAETIIRLLSDEDLRCKIGDKGSESVRRDYNLTNYSQLIKRVYLKVIGNSITE